MLPYEVRNCSALSPTNCAIDRRSLRSSSSMPLSSAILKTRFSTPDWMSFRLRIRPRRSGPISETVARTGCPCSPKRSQKVTGYPWYSNPSSLSCATRSTTFGLSPPGRGIPDRSPFTSARKTGTPIALNRSASTRSVTVLPVPVAPAIRPCRLAIPGSSAISFFPLAIGSGAGASVIGRPPGVLWSERRIPPYYITLERDPAAFVV